MSQRGARHIPGVPPALLLPALAFLLYVRTLAPSVATLFDDSLEFQVVIPLLGVPHPPGYPLYVLAGKLWTMLVPLHDPAWRLNLFSALAAAIALHYLYRLTFLLVPRHRSVAPAVALLALAPTFWGQATIAEVYALHMALMSAILFITVSLAMDAPMSSQDSRREHTRTLLLCFALLGMSLAHHRMTLLLMPAVTYLLWATRRRLPHTATTWGLAVALLFAPLLLYLYIPLVGARVGSLDGTYRNTWPAFLDWIQARAYRVFLTGNPFNVHREGLDYVRIYLDEMGTAALALTLLGTNRHRWSRPLWDMFFVALATHLLFVVNYKVTDIQVFFLPVLLLSVPFIAVGLEILWDGGEEFLGWMVRRRTISQQGARVLRQVLALVLVLLPLAQPVARTIDRWPDLDRSDDWAVYDLGMDIMAQPLPKRSAIVGILGETTLVRYFRDVLGYRPDLIVVPADQEQARMRAIADLLSRGHEVFITRPLPPAVPMYSLDAVGPIIRVRPPEMDDRPVPSRPLGETFTPAIALAGYDTSQRETHTGPVLRLTLYWDVQALPQDEYKISARLLRPDGSVARAVDDVPVHNTYPTRGWKPGERVVDVYDIPIPSGPIGDVLVILYRATDGAEVHRIQLAR